MTDASGAVVLGAEVRAVNPGTGEQRTTQTNDQGSYTIPSLEVGTYDVHFNLKGFGEVVTRGVDLHVATVYTVNAELRVGSSTESVTVEANALQVQTEEGSLGSTVEGSRIRELPTNGRNFLALTQLQPGISGANNLNTVDKGVAGGIDFSVNGNSTDFNLFLVDGSINNDRGSNRTLLVYPSLEAISEFKILSNAYGPEYGQAAGAIVNIVTRGGTNEFHGSAFYFGRNDVLNARTYAAAQNTFVAQQTGAKLPNGGKDVLRRNDYGYVFGGPLKKDKLFFFWSQEWNSERRGQTRTSCVPTAAERAGQFTSTTGGAGTPVCAGTNLTRTFTPDAAGALFLQQFPLPTLPVVNAQGLNWFQSLTAPIDWRQENARVDYNLTKSNAVMVRYTQDHWKNPAPDSQNSGFWGDDNLPGLESNWVSPGKSLTAKVTSTITSTLVNEAAFNYSNNSIANTVGGTGGVSVDQGNPAKLVADMDAAIPPVFTQTLKSTKVGSPWLGFGGGGAYVAGGPTWVLAPWNNNYDVYSVRDDLTKIHGTHTFKVGGLLDWNTKNEQQGGAYQQYPQIGGCATGQTCSSNPIQNILTPGVVFNLQETTSDPIGEARWRDYEFYVGDTWKAKRRLTINYGVRYSLMPEPYTANNKISRWDPRFYNPALPSSDACNGLVVVPGTNPCGAANANFGTNYSLGHPGPNRALMANNNHLIAPRFGLAWDVFGTGKTALRLGAGQFFQREHVNEFTNEAGNAPFTISGTVQRTLEGTPLTLPITPADKVGASNAGIFAKDPRAVLPNSWQWNATIEQEVSRGTTVQIAYVGNRGIHMIGQQDINEPLPQNWAQAAFCTSNCNSFRPYPNLGNILDFTRNGDSYYDGLQAQLRSRLGKTLNLQISYTWSHTIEDQDVANGGTNNPSQLSFRDTYNHSLDRGNATINRPHIFVTNLVYNAPSFSGSNSFVRGVIGGWELAGIGTAESGNSYQVYAGNPTDDFGGSKITSLSGNLPLGGNPNTGPNLVPGVSCGSGRHGNQILNPKAFTLIGFHIGNFGNTPRGVCEGARFADLDFSIDKNWHMPFTHRETARIQFRLDFFNIFNHPNFATQNIGNDIGNGTHILCGAPDAAGNFAACSPANNVISHWSNSALFVVPNGQAGFTPSTSNLVGNPTPGAPAGFGNTTNTGSFVPREIQYGLKFIF